MKKFLHLCGFLVALSFVGPALAVTDGDLDGENHPYVGLMFAHDGQFGWRCSGTLISPTVFVTAGHCTDGAIFATVYFDADVDAVLNGASPFGGGENGVPFLSPDYIPEAFFVNDLGVVVLNEPVVLAGGYAELVAGAGVLDAMKTRRGKKHDRLFTAVGYGLQRINPVFIEDAWVRMVATPHLIQINTPGFTGNFSMLLSNNHSTGGTCFGDSGGPNFIGDTNVIGGVTSFGLNGNCAGTGGVYRLDRAHDLEWLADFLD